MAGNARRQRWQPWQSRQRGLCKLQTPKELIGSESHPLRQLTPRASRRFPYMDERSLRLIPYRPETEIGNADRPARLRCAALQARPGHLRCQTSQKLLNGTWSFPSPSRFSDVASCPGRVAVLTVRAHSAHRVRVGRAAAQCCHRPASVIVWDVASPSHFARSVSGATIDG